MLGDFLIELSLGGGRPTWEIDVKVANILTINMYLLCNIGRCHSINFFGLRRLPKHAFKISGYFFLITKIANIWFFKI